MPAVMAKAACPRATIALSMLGMDVLALLESLKIGSAMFCGISIGGMTGIWLGLHAGSRISKVILASTAARIGTPESWNDRIRTSSSTDWRRVAAGLHSIAGSLPNFVSARAD